ncbi:cyclic nucleotide-binding domain-containing protein (plasmid) [Nostoc sp. UHCC 0926]|uniref:cyclic nucleotide-binding domain-containing protein n=1 Tax=Nostoc sp. UHCC 0926 TaxID=3025190 RepID=UPI00235E336A|nr:cyclic nucleotide-binding domain-containing protein [Nostoc sp. UHCC 0926]WDD36846.1 cyclic nucleotide-binding domain-containing protein [Nostoc sp. UHCC 0926]
MLCIEELINLDPFQQLLKEQLEWVCDRAQTVELCAGNVLVHEGDPAHGLFILIKGKINLTRRSQGVEIPIGQHEAPSFFGEIPVFTDEPVPVTMRALTICTIDAMDGKRLLEITTHHCDRFAHIDIIDSGSGIPPEIKTRILNLSSLPNQWGVVQDSVWKPFAGF